MAFGANICDKELLWTLWRLLDLKNHTVIASGMAQVCKQFAYLLAQNVNKVIPYLPYYEPILGAHA